MSGCCSGGLSALGLAALLAASATAFTVVKLVGAAYLVFLGLQAIRHAGTGDPSAEAARRPGAGAFWQGLATNLLNPKAALFFTALLPQFLVPGDPVALPAAMTLAAAVLSLAWLSVYALLMPRFGAVLRRPRVRQTLDGVTGAALVALGVRVALDGR